MKVRGELGGKKRAEDVLKRESMPPEKIAGAEDKKKTIMDVLRDAYNSRVIGKDEYNTAMHKLLKKEIRGDDRMIPTKFEIYKDDGSVKMILEKGEIDIPTISHVRIKKEDGVIRIRSSGKTEEIPDGKLEREIPDNGGDTDIKGEIPSKTKDTFDITELENLERELQPVDWSQDSRIRNETSNIKEDLELIDLRREFQEETEAEEELTEEEKEEEEPGVFDGIIDRFLRLTGKLSEESKKDRLRRLSLENLSKIKEIKEERRAIVGVAYVLKQFLEVRFDIPIEVTYHDLIEEIKGKDMDKELKDQLLDFFRKIPVIMYARVPVKENLPKIYSLAEKTINRLSASLE